MTQIDKNRLSRTWRRLAPALTRGLLEVLAALMLFLSGPVFAQRAQKESSKQSQPEKPPPASLAQIVPISVESLLHLSERNNLQIAQSRARAREAEIEREMAVRNWLSLIPGSPGYYRKLQAESKALRGQAELSRIISETKLDAAGTYFDLLAALTGLGIAREQEKILESLLADAQKLAATEGAARVEVVRIESELAGRRQSAAKLQSQSAAAAAKLKFLLAINPQEQIQPADRRLMAIEIVNANRPIGELVEQALQQGPGIHEMEALASVVDKKHQSKEYPQFDDFDEETCPAWEIADFLNLKVGSNAIELFTQRQKRQLLHSKGDQARLAYQEVRSRLILGVEEARQAILGGREQMHQGEEQIVKARRAYELSNERLKLLVPGSSYSEVLLSLQSLGLSQVNYLNAIREHNKAQVRLAILLGQLSS
jgi:hypothetical protein